MERVGICSCSWLGCYIRVVSSDYEHTEEKSRCFTMVVYASYEQVTLSALMVVTDALSDHYKFAKLDA